MDNMKIILKKTNKINVENKRRKQSATATAKPQRAVARFLPSFRFRIACCYSVSHSAAAVFHRFRSIEARDKAKRNCPTTARYYIGFPPSRTANADSIRVFNAAPAATSTSLHSFSFFTLTQHLIF